MKFWVDRPSTYFGEGVLKGSDLCEDFSDTQQNVGSTDDPNINGCRVREPIRIQTCCMSTDEACVRLLL